MQIRYIALLRAVNVGNHRVKMERLRELFALAGLQNTGTYINSGNVFFDSDETDREKLAAVLEDNLRSALGFEVPVFLMTADGLRAVLDEAPFKGRQPEKDERFCVVFTKQPFDPGIGLPVRSSKDDMELLAVKDNAAYVTWRIIKGRPPSGRFDKSVLPALNTTRFYHTLLKILAAAGSSSSA